MLLADIALARRLEASEGVAGSFFVEARRRISPESDAGWIEVAGARAMFDGPDSPLTQAFGLGLQAEPSAADLDLIEAFFRERGASVNLEISPFGGVELAQSLSRRGYRPIEYTNVLYKPLLSAAEDTKPVESAVRVRLMTPGEEEAWSQISARGWAEHPEWTEFLQSLGRVIASSEGTWPFFAELENEPVATGVLTCHERVALFGGASTIPAARSRGAQGALLAARMKFAMAEGCDLAMMCASPGSVSQCNAERKGFRVAYTRTKWQLALETD
ncbi:MAG TPA: hypothetical protein VG273_11475 [Bryobacteraceae bacterium]|nr:hypothetical protein [Bryobacteraceae bacterium]